MILGVNFTGNRNVGDKNCSPLQYFAFPGATVAADVRGLLGATPSDESIEAVILGGGTMARWIPKGQFPADAKLIAWSVGYTQRELLQRHTDTYHAAAAHLCGLYGNRDWGSDVGEYVPCVSCMHPAFDEDYEVQHELVFYGHEILSPFHGVPGPRLTNAEESMSRAIAFLGSGATIVTSSFHGAYWGILLGRRVVVVPFGSKFYHLRWPVPLVQDWREGLSQATAFPDALEESRALNEVFYDRVLEVI